jgi:uncharacterized protein YkwD
MRSVALVLCTATSMLLVLLAVPAAQGSGPRIDQGERAIIRAINHQRARYGLRGLSGSTRLARAADQHSWEMLARDSFSHGNFVQRVRHYASFHALGETIAMTSRCSAGRIVSMWMHSPPHRTVLLSRTYRRVGIGRRTGRMGLMRACMVTADFGSRH